MPISAHKSLVPINSTSIPGTAAISSALAIAVGVSSMTIVRLAELSAEAASPRTGRTQSVMRPDATHRAVTERRVFQPVDDFARLGCRIDMRHDDAERAIVQGTSGDCILPVRHPRDRRDAGVERRGRDLRASLERHDAVLHVEK